MNIFSITLTKSCYQFCSKTILPEKISFGRRITTPKMGLDMVTIFGYSAPKSDIEAVGMLKSAWGDPTERALEEIEIIDLRPEDELYSSWEEFIHTPLLLP